MEAKVLIVFFIPSFLTSAPVEVDLIKGGVKERGMYVGGNRREGGGMRDTGKYGDGRRGSGREMKKGNMLKKTRNDTAKGYH